jgi:hypothetical protein
MTVNSDRAAASMRAYSAADEAFTKAALSIGSKIAGLETRMLEQAGRMDWFRLEMRNQELDITRLETENGFMGERLKLIQTELKLAQDELRIWKKLAEDAGKGRLTKIETLKEGN